MTNDLTPVWTVAFDEIRIISVGACQCKCHTYIQLPLVTLRSARDRPTTEYSCSASFSQPFHPCRDFNYFKRNNSSHHQLLSIASFAERNWSKQKNLTGKPIRIHFGNGIGIQLRTIDSSNDRTSRRRRECRKGR